MRIDVTAGIVAELLATARREAPSECCGLLGGTDSVIRTAYPLRNVASSPETRYEADPNELFRAHRSMREQNDAFLGIYHSHPRSPAYPSATDVKLAFYPDVVYFIISLAEESGALNAFLICDEQTTQVEYRLID